QSRLWVGVWEFDGPPPNPMDPNTPVLRSWLTSASQAGVSASDALSDDDSVIIAGGFEYPDPDDPDKAYKDYDPVRVPLLSIAQPDTQSAGRYAYWVEDEGMKANLNIVNPYLDDDPDSAEG